MCENSALRGDLKPIERRLKVLDEYLRQAGLIAKHAPIYRKYLEQKAKSREVFYESHRTEIMLFEAANRYMKEHLNGRTVIPVLD